MGRDTRGRRPRFYEENDALLLKDGSIALVVASAEDGQSVLVQPVHDPERKSIDLDEIERAFAGLGLRGRRFTSTDRERALQLLGGVHEELGAVDGAMVHAVLDVAEAIRELPEAIVRRWDEEPITVPADDGANGGAS